MFMQMLKVIDAGSFQSHLIYNASDECPCLEETAKNITDLPFCVKTSAEKKKEKLLTILTTIRSTASLCMHEGCFT